MTRVGEEVGDFDAGVGGGGLLELDRHSTLRVVLREEQEEEEEEEEDGGGVEA